MIARYVAGDWDGSLEAAELAGDRTPDSVLARLAAAALYVEVSRGLPGAVERVRQLRGAWSQDTSLALIAGGCEADLLRWRGDLDGAVRAADHAIAYVSRRWEKWYLGGIWLAALGLAALADRAETERLRGDEAAVEASVARGRELIEHARTTAQRGRPRHGRMGPEGQGWLARAEAEWSRLEGWSDPERVAGGAGAVRLRLPVRAGPLPVAAGRGAARRGPAGEAAGARWPQAHRVAVQLGATPLREALEALARRGRLDAGLPVPVPAERDPADAPGSGTCWRCSPAAGPTGRSAARSSSRRRRRACTCPTSSASSARPGGPRRWRSRTGAVLVPMTEEARSGRQEDVISQPRRGGATRSSTRSTCAASPTATATASATWPASAPGCRTCATSVSTRSGSPLLRVAAGRRAATTSPTTATSTRCSATSPTSTRWSRTPTAWACGCIVDLVPNHSLRPARRGSSEALAAGPGSPARDRFHFRDGRGPDGERAAQQLAVASSAARPGPGSPSRRPPGEWYLHLFDAGAARPQLGPPGGARRVRATSCGSGSTGASTASASTSPHGLVKDAGLPDVGTDPRLDAPARRRSRRTGTRTRCTTSTAPGGGCSTSTRGDRDARSARRWVPDAAAAAPGTCAPTSCTRPSTSTSWAPRWDADALREVIDDAAGRARRRSGAPATWVLSNHDVVRHVTRYGERPPSAAAASAPRRAAAPRALLMLALPGSAYLYQGEELGLPEVVDLPDEAAPGPDLPPHRRPSTGGRDGCRVPLPWSGDAAAVRLRRRTRARRGCRNARWAG